MQRFIEAQDPETGQKMEFDELRAETSSLMYVMTATVQMNRLTSREQGRRSKYRKRNDELDDLLSLQEPQN